MIDYRLIGKRIKEIRTLRGVTQARLAEMADLSVSYVSIIESGKKSASLQSLVGIADIMGVTVDTLLYGNQAIRKTEYHHEIAYVMEDCTNYERRIIFDQILALKTSLRDNRFLLNGVDSTCDS